MIFRLGRAIIEAVLLASPEPLPARRIAEIAGLDERAARDLCEDLAREYRESERGFHLVEVAGGFQLVTRPDLSEYVAAIFPHRDSRLTPTVLETLAVIAYRQPVTRAEIEAIKGVKVDHSLYSLMERGLIKDAGRREGPGRPILYGTTKLFLEYMGLKDLNSLPPLPEINHSGP